MNRTYALALSVSCAAAGAAYADDITIEPHPFNPARRAEGTLTRAQVTAEFMAARNLVAALSGEDSGSDYLTRLAAAKAQPGAAEIARVE